MQNDVSGSKKEKSELPEIIFEEENFISVAKRKAKFFLTNITLEPVMLFYGKYQYCKVMRLTVLVSRRHQIHR